MVNRNGQGAADTGGRSAADGAQDQLPDTPESLILAGIQAGIAGGTIDGGDEDDEDALGTSDDSDELESDAGDDGDAGDLEDDDEGDLDADQEQTQARDKPAASKPKTRRTAEEWAKLVATDGLQRVAEVPNVALRDPAFMRTYHAEVARQATAAAQAQIAESLAAQEQYKVYVASVEEMFDGDPDGLLDWIRTDPQGPVYVEAKQTVAAIQQQTPDQRVAQAGEYAQLNARSQRQFSRLERFPDLQAELVRRQTEEQKYPASAEGLERLERDVDELIEQGLSRGAATEQRGGGQAPPARPRAARPLVGSGTAAPAAARNGGPDISKINDPEELFTMGAATGIAESKRARGGRGRR